MPHVLQSVKSVGGNITRAELVTFLDNLEWFRTPPAYRVYSLGGETVETTIGVMDWSPSAGGHNEWREGGAGNLSTVYTDSTAGLWVNVGDVEPGVWLNGVMFAVQNVITIIGGQTPRSVNVQLRRGDGTTWTELADYVAEDKNSGRRGAVHLFGLGTFSAGTDRVEARARASSGSRPVVVDRRWGFRTGSQTDYSVDYAAARQVSDTNNEMVGAFNRLRGNQARIERRPSAHVWRNVTALSLPSTMTYIACQASDWATPAVMTTATAGGITAQTSGVWLVQGQLTLAGYSSGGSFAEAAVFNGSDSVVTANAPEANNYFTVVPVCDLVTASDGDLLTLRGRSGTSSNVELSRGTHLTATLMSSNSGVSPGRQVWDRMPAPATWPNIAGMSSGRCPAGTLRVLSDLTDRQWHVPAFKATLNEDAEIKFGAGWTDVDVDTMLFDYTGLEGTHGRRILSGGALVLPWAGIWLVGARLAFSRMSVDGVNVGNVGVRGMRIALGDNQSAGAFIGAAMNAAGHSWARTVAETVVVNRDEGQEVRLQGFAAAAIGPTSSIVAATASSITTVAQAASAIGDLAEQIDDDDYEIPITQAHIWAVELGEGITRVPR